MRDHVRASFRNAPHSPGVAQVKPRDFLPLPEVLLGGDAIEAATPYAAWHEMLGSERPLIIGDLLESADDGKLFLCKYVGFEQAQWVVPEVAAAETPGGLAANNAANNAANSEGTRETATASAS